MLSGKLFGLFGQVSHICATTYGKSSSFQIAAFNTLRPHKILESVWPSTTPGSTTSASQPSGSSIFTQLLDACLNSLVTSGLIALLPKIPVLIFLLYQIIYILSITDAPLYDYLSRRSALSAAATCAICLLGPAPLPRSLPSTNTPTVKVFS